MKMAINAVEYYLPADSENGRSLQSDNSEWCIEEIEEKTGIVTRYISAPGQTATDMAVLAAEKLLCTKANADDIDFLIFVTQSPDYALPTSACVLHDRLSLKLSCMSFDVNLGCSGYIYGLAIAGGLMEAGLARQGLLICSDTYSKYINKHDRSCRPLFSDAAAATHLVYDERDPLISFELGTDGSGFESLIVKVGGARHTQDPEQEKQLYMHGSNVFLFTLHRVPLCVQALLNKSGKDIDDIDLFIFHQASKLVIDSIVDRLGLPEKKVFTNYRDIGNTVSATIPIALNNAVAAGRLRAGDEVMLVGFGVGYSWGGCIIRWESPQ